METLELYIQELAASEPELAIYEDNSGKPGVLKAHGKVVLASTIEEKWIALNGLEVSVTAGVKYWLAFLSLIPLKCKQKTAGAENSCKGTATETALKGSPSVTALEAPELLSFAAVGTEGSKTTRETSGHSALLFSAKATAFEPVLLPGGTAFVTLAGNDSNDGETWATAKRTIPAAIAALPRSAEGLHTGVVQVGYGTYEVSSTRREDEKCVFFNGSAYVECPSATTADIGAILMKPSMIGFEAKEIIDVWEGELGTENKKIPKEGTGKKFVTMESSTGESGETLLFIIKPAIVMPAGVKIRGLGPMGGHAGYISAGWPTRIKDVGGGITILGPRSFSDGPGEAAKGGYVEQLTLHGNDTALDGYFAQNVFGTVIRSVAAEHYMRWGLDFGNNAVAQLELDDVLAQFNGTANGTVGKATKVLGGGIRCYEGAPVGNAQSVICRTNNGVGMLAYGMHILGGNFSHNSRQEYETKKYINQSGVGIVLGTENTPSQLFGGWLEGNAEANIESRGGTIIGVHLQGDGGGNFAEYGIVANGYTFIAGTHFQKHTKAAILEGGGEPPIIWTACESQARGEETTWLKRTKSDRNLYVVAGGVENAPRTFVETGTGRTGSEHEEEAAAFISSPPEATKLKLESEVTYQNTKERDLRLAIPIKYEAGGKVEVKTGQATPGAVIGTPERSSAGKEILNVYLPARWYLTLKLTGATFDGEATAQAG
ncbi:MAG TPA: hypothetical protein VH061_12405 [Solirubrobacteraceae bacterium]|nr:hypothetical protein [Solirubrobacteraceae bacterium]